MSMSERQLERIVKGCANHRRIQMMELLHKDPELTLQDVAQRLKIGVKTASEHLRRLAIAGLVMKRYDHRWVRHRLSRRGRVILTFLRKLE